MPKAEKGSVKDIANRMKAKGLQKLKFYCQMCQKQCRDANGFKCHTQSESHLRQMKIFGDNAHGFLKQYSDDFEKYFLTNLKMRHGTKKVNANNVYQEVIADKQHIHMNATHWTTLTDFVQYLGRSGKCVVEENHSDGTGGWMVSYIERDSGILARREAQQRREASDKRAEEALLERMKVQRIEAAKALERATGSKGGKVEATSILSGDGSSSNNNLQPIKLGIAANTKKKNKASAFAAKNTTGAAFGDDEEDDDDENNAGSKRNPSKSTNVERMMNETRRNSSISASGLDTDRRATRKRGRDTTTLAATNSSRDDGANLSKRSKQEEPNAKEHKHSDREQQKQDNWLYRDILVRVISKKLEGGKYFRKKAVVDRVLGDGFVAEVEVLDAKDGYGDVLKLDQRDLETVVPKLNSGSNKVRILRGDFRGKKATVEYLDKKRYQAGLLLLVSSSSKGKKKGGREYQDDDGQRRLLKDVPYEDFSQIA